MLLSVENLSVSYGNIKALHGISFEVSEGEIVCIIGANGAGKSTTLRAISRLIPAESGSKMAFQDKNLLDYPADKVVTDLGISHVPEGRRLFENLTVTENLKLATFARNDTEAIEADRERVFSIFPRLKERINQKAGTLSGGEQQMLAVARGLMSNPKILLVDEPSLGLAPILVSEVIAKIKDLKEQYGLAVLMTEQNFNQAIKIADRGYIIVEGKIEFEGKDTAELSEHELVKKFYLGA